MIDKHKLIRPDYDLSDFFRKKAANPDCAFTICDERVLLIDPVYLADVYNADDSDSDFIRRNGLIVQGFGGDISGQVILTDSVLLMPISLHYSQGGELPQPKKKWIKASALGCDSGSFVFLPLTPDVPASISRIADAEVAKQNGVLLQLHPGRWELYFEQFTVICPQ